MRFPTNMRAVLCAILATALAGRATAEDDVAHIPAQDKTVAAQPQQRYVLIGDARREAPAAGFGLLLVLPGGDGAASFGPFVKRIFDNALPEGFLIAQLVAVPSNNPRQVVWPTARTRDPKQTFTTESFVAGVVADVSKAHNIDSARVLTLAWSSGGPAAYSASVAKGSPVKGSLVAMSIFPAGDIKPSIANAKSRRYYLLHSPEDTVTKYHFARTAKTQLTAAGAAVEVVDYAGGHGWHGDVFGNIRAGIEWLDAKGTGGDSKNAARDAGAASKE